jgi:hypothetical protein
MKKPFSVLITLLLLTLAGNFTSCKKEYSYEGGPQSTAVYTFLGAGAACTSAVINGNYFTGVQLNAGNTIQLQVSVTNAGTYNVSTNSINGIVFSGSGNFTDTGAQVITLTGSGTPVTEGDFTFNTPGSSSCSFLVTVTKKPVTNASYTIDGAPDACQNFTLSGNFIYGTALTAANTIILTVNVTAPGPYNITTDTLDGISFSNSGTFTSAGIHQVTLNGNGTPTTPANLLFNVTGDSTACSLGVSVVNPPPLATYVLESDFGNPNPCNHTVLAGSYTALTPLDVTNTISINVYVSVVGNFTVSTNTVNGIMFSRTGTFTTTGEQALVLKGSGTPTIVGGYLFNSQIIGPHPLGGESCAITLPVK